VKEVLLPKMGETMETGIIEKWRKKEGDKIEKGDILYDLSTDKVSIEIESFESGYLRKIVRNEGEEIPIMEVIAYIGEKDEPIPDKTGDRKINGKNPISSLGKIIFEKNNIDTCKTTGTETDKKILGEDIKKFINDIEEKEKTSQTEVDRLFISPFAKKTAKELGIDIRTSKIKGTSFNGRIISTDIISYAKNSYLDAAEEKNFRQKHFGASIKIISTQPIKGIRKIISEKMMDSNQNIPHISLYSVCDATRLIELRSYVKETIEKNYGIKITYTDFLVKIAAEALCEFREINSSIQESIHIIYEDINIGIVVSIPSSNTIIVPTIFNADKMKVIEIAKLRTDLTKKGRDGKLNLDEISNATFTISNLGMYGVRSFTAIINPPQAAILMVSEMYETPMVVNNQIKIRTCVEIGLTVDHRIIDGALSAKYLARVKEFIENPDFLIL